MRELSLLTVKLTPDLIAWMSSISIDQLRILMQRLGLSGEEQERVRRYRHPADRLRSILGRWLAFRHFTGLRNSENGPLLFSRDAYDRPIMIKPTFCDSFSISHHGEWVVFAAGDTITLDTSIRIGVDVMNVEERPVPMHVLNNYDQGMRESNDGSSPLNNTNQQHAEDLAYFNEMSGVFTAREFQSILDMPAGQPRWTQFYRLWAMKESRVKALGRGLAVDLQSIDCYFPPDNNDLINNTDVAADDDGSVKVVKINTWNFWIKMLDKQHLCVVCTDCSNVTMIIQELSYNHTH